MTAAVFRNTPSMSVPLTQNTAPVLEFDCLYTHDSRKKTKKWQDGFLRYHTFNKRVLVYDVPRNLIGDMHWSGEEAVQCGDELSLDRNGVMVEVAEQIGQTETDLTELRKSKNKPSSHVRSPAPRTAIAQTPRAQPAGLVERCNTQLKHKSLNTLLGTPRGPIGKAQLPSRSPFEDRHADVENEAWTEGRPPKRPRMDSAPAWNVTHTTTTAEQPVHRAETPLRARTTDAVKQKKSAPVPAGQQRLGTKEVIDLSDDSPQTNGFLPGFSDDALAQSQPSPPGQRRPVTASRTLGRSSSPTSQVQQVRPKPIQELVKPPAEKSPPRSRTDQNGPALHRQSATESLTSEREQQQRTSNSRAERLRSCSIARPAQPSKPTSKVTTSSRTGQTLRLASTNRKKRTLLCHDQLTSKPKRLLSTSTDEAVDSLLSHADDGDHEEKPLTTRERVEARLAKIRAKKKKMAKESSPRKTIRAQEPRDVPVIIDPDSSNDLPDGPSMGTVQEEQDLPPRRPQTSHEASALELARLDQLMLPPAAPRPKSAAQPPPKALDSPPMSHAPAKENRTLRRVVSESSVLRPLAKPKRAQGAPVRYTPSPTRRSRESTPASTTASRQATPVQDKHQQRPPRSPPDRTTYKKKGPFQKSASLNMTSNGTSTVMLAKPFQKPSKASVQRKAADEPKDLGPWSREAFDLFDWRPPGWDEEKWCFGEGGAAGKVSTNSGAPRPPPPGLSGGAALPTFGRPVV